VHVWRADLSAVAADLGGLLSPAERARAGRMSRERDRQLWTRAHGVLRALLGRYLESDPRTLHITTEAHGKPGLLDDAFASAGAQATHAEATQALPPRLSFNLAHSGQLALYAFTAAGSVGVDVEVARRPLNEVGIAERIFGAVEARRLSVLDPKAREREFRRLWARHEAELKYWGTGLADQATGTSKRKPWVAELDVGPRAAAAVAVKDAPRELRCWDWRT
jgi:4'-phosphopantetheinyl transferase